MAKSLKAMARVWQPNTGYFPNRENRALIKIGQVEWKRSRLGTVLKSFSARLSFHEPHQLGSNLVQPPPIGFALVL